MVMLKTWFIGQLPAEGQIPVNVTVQGFPAVVAKTGGGVIPIGAVRVYVGAFGDDLSTIIVSGIVIMILPFYGIGFFSLIWKSTFSTWDVPGGSGVGVILETVAVSLPDVVICTVIWLSALAAIPVSIRDLTEFTVANDWMVKGSVADFVCGLRILLFV